MKFNMDTAGVTFNAAIIVKLKKMYSNIRKLYVLNMYRVFLMMEKEEVITLIVEDLLNSKKILDKDLMNLF